MAAVVEVEVGGVAGERELDEVRSVESREERKEKLGMQLKKRQRGIRGS